MYQNITVVVCIKEDVVANWKDNKSLRQKITVWLVDNMGGGGLQEIHSVNQTVIVLSVLLALLLPAMSLRFMGKPERCHRRKQLSVRKRNNSIGGSVSISHFAHLLFYISKDKKKKKHFSNYKNFLKIRFFFCFHHPFPLRHSKRE